MLQPYTKTFHHTPYPAISPTLPALSTSGKVVVITGGGSGLGPSIASSFAQSGSTSIALIGRTASSLTSTANSLSSTFAALKILTFTADISSSSDVASVFSSIKEKLGPIDILVSNAAYLPNMTGLAEYEESELMKGFETNVKGNLNLAQALLKNSVESPTLVHVSAAAIHIPPFQKGMGAYVSSKYVFPKRIELSIQGDS
jgi:NAD(P)-dependent dehydrogenase (short-subunit alcohol dehydrogenase family)